MTLMLMLPLVSLLMTNSTMQAQDVSMAPPAFPKLPKSALFSKLQSFLPVMEQENKKLEQAMASGNGAKHSIEVNDDDDDADGDATAAEPSLSSPAATDAVKPPVIEMNFALGVMDDEHASDDNGDSSDDDDDTDDLKTAIFAASTAADGSDAAASTSASLRDLKLAPASTKPRPMIQELD